HKFMNWQKPILTDSGGFQVFSLGGLREVKDNGVIFNSHINGDQHLMTPEKVIKIQKGLGSDIMMPLDEVVGYPTERKKVEKALMRTTAWTKRAKEEFDNICDPKSQTLFGITQGGLFKDLRKRSSEEIVEIDLPGYAIGGLSVGEPKDEMYPLIEYSASLLPENKPRYLMGIGEPEDLEFAIKQGVDMFDCVIPTRLARHGAMLTSIGTINIDNARFQKDFTAPDQRCDCYTCQNFTRAYLRHLYMNKELLGAVLMTLHNIRYLINLVHKIRQDILEE
ncbi:MAG: tRNA guanosine(34) transglycosylase Tgt, partial [Candidatus Margulisbacteria bacterium]|nr:tRNA guanosine(34) transglycosylase Tgt [Candidatus Margulisiibacteriota bacterium]